MRATHVPLPRWCVQDRADAAARGGWQGYPAPPPNAFTAAGPPSGHQPPPPAAPPAAPQPPGARENGSAVDAGTGSAGRAHEQFAESMQYDQEMQQDHGDPHPPNPFQQITEPAAAAAAPTALPGRFEPGPSSPQTFGRRLTAGLRRDQSGSNLFGGAM
jgi:hypothetical protein